MAGISTRGRAVRLASALIVAVGASAGAVGVAAANEPSARQDTATAATAVSGVRDDGQGHGKKDREEGTAKPKSGKEGKEGKEAKGGAGAADSPKGAVPGDNGTVKIHEAGTSADDRRNEPHVCRFYLDAFGFDAGQAVIWTIHRHPPTGRSLATAGTLVLDGEGHGRTDVMGLPDGHYKLTWTFAGEHGKAKHKVFWVDCKPGKDGDKPDCKPDDTNGKDGKDGKDDKGKDKPDCRKGDKPGDKPDCKPTDKPTDKQGKDGKDGDKPDKDGDKPDCKPGEKPDDKPGDKRASDVKGAAAPSAEADSLALTGAQTMGLIGAALALLGGGMAILLFSGRLNGILRRRQ